MAFAQMTLGMRGVPMRGRSSASSVTRVVFEPARGEDEDDFVIWILGATREVEVSLAEQGFFKDMRLTCNQPSSLFQRDLEKRKLGSRNWLDRAPTTVYIIGDNLLEELIVEEAGKPKAKEPQASVTKDDAATYVVVYSRVFVRDQPSIEGKYVGDLGGKIGWETHCQLCSVRIKMQLGLRPSGLLPGDLFEGTEVHGREEGGWLRLDSVPWLKD